MMEGIKAQQAPTLEGNKNIKEEQNLDLEKIEKRSNSLSNINASLNSSAKDLGINVEKLSTDNILSRFNLNKKEELITEENNLEKNEEESFSLEEVKEIENRLEIKNQELQKEAKKFNLNPLKIMDKYNSLDKKWKLAIIAGVVAGSIALPGVGQAAGLALGMSGTREAYNKQYEKNIEKGKSEKEAKWNAFKSKQMLGTAAVSLLSVFGFGIAEHGVHSLMHGANEIAVEGSKSFASMIGHVATEKIAEITHHNINSINLNKLKEIFT